MNAEDTAYKIADEFFTARYFERKILTRDEMAEIICHYLAKHAPAEGWRPIVESDKEDMKRKTVSADGEIKHAIWFSDSAIWWYPDHDTEWALKNQPTLIFEIPLPPQPDAEVGG